MSYEFEVKSPINLTSACYQVSYFTATLSAGTKLQFMQFLTFRPQCRCVYTQAIKQMVYTETVKNDPHKFCHLNWPCCYSSTFKIYQKHLFSRVKTENMEIAVLSFITIYTHKTVYNKTVYQQIILLKIIMYIIIFIMYQTIIYMNLGFKFLLYLNGKRFAKKCIYTL